MLPEAQRRAGGMTIDVDLCKGDFWAGDHHAAFARLRAEDPVHWDGSIWGITRYEDVRAVSKDPGTFTSSQGIRPRYPALPMMIDMDDPEHLHRRMVVNKGFTPRRIRDSEPAIRAACDEIIDAVCERGECDFVTDIAAKLPMIMIGDALGVAPEDRDELLQWSDDMLQGQSTTASIEAITKATDAFVAYNDYAAGAIAERRECPRDDLMSVLVHAEVDGHRLDDETLMQESLLILVGGDETTRHVISGGMYALIDHPDQRVALAADRSLLPSAVEEMLRWVSPIKNMARTATRDAVLGGSEIHEGDELLLLYPSANRDEDVFDDPFGFDITRSPNEHVAFGFGSHFCLGASLARLELLVMFDRLLDRLPDLTLADPTGSEPARRPANFISGYEAMPVVFSPVAPCNP
jgi:cytochrome P450 family 142 subfamily A polypeptide 1